MLQKLFQTDNDTAALILRVFLGVVMFPHGAQKLLGWFGGNGFSATMGFFTETMGIPAVLAFLVIIGESVGAIGLIVGLLTRVASFGLAIIMTVAAFIHAPNGFFMNWFGNQQGEGYEYHLLAIAIAIAITIKGAGRWSIDGWIFKNEKDANQSPQILSATS